MSELNLQDKFLIPFFTNNVKGLGYTEVKANTIDKDSLIIESDLCGFLSTSDINKDNYEKLLKKYKNDKDKMCLELIEFLQSKIKDFRNMALFLNHNNSSFTFEGFKFYLFNRSGSMTKNDDDFNQNIFSVVAELVYKFSYQGNKAFEFRPDISLFVNGIYLGYSELKSNYSNQSAKKNGRGKVIKDYQKAVIDYLEIVKRYQLDDKEALELRKDMLKVFEKAIHISTTDIKDTFIIRDISRHFEEIQKNFKNGKCNYEQYKQNIIKGFKPYPLIENIKEYERKQDKLSEVFKAHFSKKMIEKEILYYNFIEREVIKDKNANILKNAKGILISPRPKQKFGVDKIMNKIDEFLAHEDEPDYFINKLKEQLKHLSESKRNELIEKRLSYQNNKNIYSLLLQYAAGFGKSNIIGWSALQLKDLKKDGEYVYDKIMIIVDRVQLRDQLSTKMFNMNVNNKMYMEAYNKSTFQKALSNDTRLIIVNLQKFGDMANILESDTIEKLKSLRVVFLIDEIHRSNDNTQHDNLTGTFDEIQTSFDKNEKYTQGKHKKNLIIGFTATPSDKTLARFGEFDKYGESERLWKPFDSYTMHEAIKDGYILNPLKGIVTVSAKMYFELPQDELKGFREKGEEVQYQIKKKKIYENPDRIDAIAKHISKNLVQVVYKQIRGTAKAMLATSSIKSATMYKQSLQEHFNDIVKDKKYARFEDVPIFIIYSPSQDELSATSLNDGLSEAKVLQKFKEPKNNGIIIVVDKLQTGFDEPKLHTLFLDKEVRGINAIQTISRVNRTTKHKTDCKIVDFSYKNINHHNIKEAFEHFSDMVVSDFDPLGEIKLLDTIYDDLKVSVIYKEYFKFFIQLCNDKEADPDKIMDLENSFERFINSNPEKSKELKKKINKYFRILGLIEYVIDFDEKYKDYCFLDFFRKYNSIYNIEHITDESMDEVLIYFDNQIGIIQSPEDKPFKPPKPPSSGGDGKNGEPHKYDILEIIKKRNEEEENIGELIEKFELQIDEFFELVIAHKNFNDLKAKISSVVFNENEVYKDFNIIYKHILRRKKDEEWDFFKKYTSDIVNKLCDDFEKSIFSE